MSIEETVSHALHERIGSVTPPPLDPAALRRSGLRQRRRRRLGALVAVAAVTAALITATGIGGASTPRGDPAPVTPVPVPVPVEGLRAFTAYEDGTAVLHLGDDVPGPEHLGGSLDTSAATSPYGVLDIGSDGVPYLVTATGDEIALGDPTDPQGVDFRASIAGDPEGPYVAWSSGTETGVRLHLYTVDAGAEVAVADVPCPAGDRCDLEVVATGGGLVFVRTPAGTAVWDPDHGDGLAPLTGPGTDVIDIGGHTVLLDGSGRRGPVRDGPTGPLAGGSWQVVWSTASDDALSGDGRWLLGYAAHGTRDVRGLDSDGSTAPVLSLDDVVNADFDTDSSLLTVVNRGGGHYVLIDHDLPSGDGEVVYRSALGMEPALLGNDS